VCPRPPTTAITPTEAAATAGSDGAPTESSGYTADFIDEDVSGAAVAAGAAGYATAAGIPPLPADTRAGAAQAVGFVSPAARVPCADEARSGNDSSGAMLDTSAAGTPGTLGRAAPGASTLFSEQSATPLPELAVADTSGSGAAAAFVDTDDGAHKVVGGRTLLATAVGSGGAEATELSPFIDEERDMATTATALAATSGTEKVVAATSGIPAVDKLTPAEPPPPPPAEPAAPGPATGEDVVAAPGTPPRDASFADGSTPASTSFVDEDNGPMLPGTAGPVSDEVPSYSYSGDFESPASPAVAAPLLPPPQSQPPATPVAAPATCTADSLAQMASPRAALAGMLDASADIHTQAQATIVSAPMASTAEEQGEAGAPTVLATAEGVTLPASPAATAAAAGVAASGPPAVEETPPMQGDASAASLGMVDEEVEGEVAEHTGGDVPHTSVASPLAPPKVIAAPDAASGAPSSAEGTEPPHAAAESGSAELAGTSLATKAPVVEMLAPTEVDAGASALMMIDEEEDGRVERSSGAIETTPAGMENAPESPTAPPKPAGLDMPASLPSPGRHSSLGSSIAAAAAAAVVPGATVQAPARPADASSSSGDGSYGDDFDESPAAPLEPPAADSAGPGETVAADAAGSDEASCEMFDTSSGALASLPSVRQPAASVVSPPTQDRSVAEHAANLVAAPENSQTSEKMPEQEPLGGTQPLTDHAMLVPPPTATTGVHGGVTVTAVAEMPPPKHALAETMAATAAPAAPTDTTVDVSLDTLTGAGTSTLPEADATVAAQVSSPPFARSQPSQQATAASSNVEVPTVPCSPLSRDSRAATPSPTTRAKSPPPPQCPPYEGAEAPATLDATLDVSLASSGGAAASRGIEPDDVIAALRPPVPMAAEIAAVARASPSTAAKLAPATSPPLAGDTTATKHAAAATAAAVTTVAIGDTTLDVTLALALPSPDDAVSPSPTATSALPSTEPSHVAAESHENGAAATTSDSHGDITVDVTLGDAALIAAMAEAGAYVTTPAEAPSPAMPLVPRRVRVEDNAVVTAPTTVTATSAASASETRPEQQPSSIALHVTTARGATTVREAPSSAGMADSSATADQTLDISLPAASPLESCAAGADQTVDVSLPAADVPPAQPPLEMGANNFSAVIDQTLDISLPAGGTLPMPGTASCEGATTTAFVPVESPAGNLTSALPRTSPEAAENEAVIRGSVQGVRAAGDADSVAIAALSVKSLPTADTSARVAAATTPLADLDAADSSRKADTASSTPPAVASAARPAPPAAQYGAGNPAAAVVMRDAARWVALIGSADPLCIDTAATEGTGTIAASPREAALPTSLSRVRCPSTGPLELAPCVFASLGTRVRK